MAGQIINPPWLHLSAEALGRLDSYRITDSSVFVGGTCSFPPHSLQTFFLVYLFSF